MLKLYGMKDCARCEQVKNILDKRNIKYKYHDLDEVDTEYYLTLIEEENKSLFPLIMKDNRVINLSDVLKEE